MIFIVGIVFLITVFFALAESYYERDIPRRTIIFVIVMAIALLCSVGAQAQNSRYDYAALTVTGSGNLIPLLAIPGATVNFYTGCTSLPCSTYANVYTSATGTTACPTTAQIVLNDTAACVAVADGEGNFGGWFLPGQYQYTITAFGATYGPYSFTVAITSGGSAGAATNLLGGALGSAPYQSAANTTAFLNCPTNAGTYLYAWQPTGSAVAPICATVAFLQLANLATGAGTQSFGSPVSAPQVTSGEINNVLYASSTSGVDLATQVPALFASCNYDCTVRIPAGTYTSTGSPTTTAATEPSYATTATQATIGSTSITVASSTGVTIGYLIGATGIPAGTLVCSSYTSGSTSVPLCSNTGSPVATTAVLNSTATTFFALGVLTLPVESTAGISAGQLITCGTGLPIGARVATSYAGSSPVPITLPTSGLITSTSCTFYTAIILDHYSESLEGDSRGVVQITSSAPTFIDDRQTASTYVLFPAGSVGGFTITCTSSSAFCITGGSVIAPKFHDLTVVGPGGEQNSTSCGTSQAFTFQNTYDWMERWTMKNVNIGGFCQNLDFKAPVASGTNSFGYGFVDGVWTNQGATTTYGVDVEPGANVYHQLGWNYQINSGSTTTANEYFHVAGTFSGEGFHATGENGGANFTAFHVVSGGSMIFQGDYNFFSSGIPVITVDTPQSAGGSIPFWINKTTTGSFGQAAGIPTLSNYDGSGRTFTVIPVDNPSFSGNFASRFGYLLSTGATGDTPYLAYAPTATLCDFTRSTAGTDASLTPTLCVNGLGIAYSVNIYAATAASGSTGLATGISSAVCTSGVTCTSKFGLITVTGATYAGGSATAFTWNWGATPAAQSCLITQLGGATWEGVGTLNGIPTATGVPVTISAPFTGSFIIQYTCGSNN